MPIRIDTPQGVVEFPDGMPPAAIEAELMKAFPAERERRLEDPSVLTPERTWGELATDALPAIGATIGGILGNAPGAALGGAGGKAWSNVVKGVTGRKPFGTPMEAAGDVALEGAIQGGLQRVSGKLSDGLVSGGRRLYGGLAKVPKAVKEGFGGGDAVVDTLIGEGATISGKGLDKVTGRLGQSRADALQMVQDAAPTATTVSPREVIGEFGPVVKELRNRADIGQASELAAVGERGKRLVGSMNRGAGTDVVRAQTLKETAQDAASGAYRARDRGATKQLSADDLLDEATAKGFRKSVESRVPGVSAQNRRTQQLLGAKLALESAVERTGSNNAVGLRDVIALGAGSGAGAIAGGPAGAIAGTLLTRILQSPRPGSGIAIAMDRLGRLGRRSPVSLDDFVRMGLVASEEK